MRANCSSAKSICSNVCVAMRLVRSRHCDGGTAGGATGLVKTPGVEQPAPHEEGLLQRADQHRHDRRLGGPDVEAQAPEAVLQPAGVGPQAVAALGLVLQHLRARRARRRCWPAAATR